MELAQPSEAQAVEMVRDVVNWPLSATFPPDSVAVGPGDLVLGLQVLYSATDEEEAYPHLPSFKGVARESCDENFILGLVALGKLQSHYAEWMSMRGGRGGIHDKSFTSAP